MTLPSSEAVPQIEATPPAVSISAADFHARVFDLDPRIAVFDCDGTLWSGDAGSSFMRWTMQTGLLSPERIAWLNRRYEQYNRGEVSELSICGEMVQVYAGLPIATLRDAAATFFAEYIEPRIFSELASLLAELRQRGVDLWAVSSTCDWVIEEGVRRFGIPPDRVLAARVSTEDDHATESLIDVPTDEGKVASLRRAGVTAPDAVFGNSIHDAAMLAIARCPFPVNPSPQLLAEAGRRGWIVFHPVGTQTP